VAVATAVAMTTAVEAVAVARAVVAVVMEGFQR
jgi:hypothetical protein